MIVDMYVVFAVSNVLLRDAYAFEKILCRASGGGGGGG
jgi:hypothetical protein